jgi:hypothetical protein
MRRIAVITPPNSAYRIALEGSAVVSNREVSRDEHAWSLL